ncbi:MAG: hypothetical protein QNJ67_07120 [Kiloniellales bacterium]|nr:hypothetical protein [Kiloniellales bacterium]
MARTTPCSSPDGRTARRSAPAHVLLVLLLGVLTACSSDGPRLFCPLGVPVRDASYMVRYDGQGRDLTNVLFEAELIDVLVLCSIDQDDESAEVELEVVVTIRAIRGLADQSREANFNYFVAVIDPKRNVMAREAFDMTVPFEGSQSRLRVEDRLETEFTIPSAEVSRDYKVYVGLELTPEEVELNRSRR